MSGTLRIADDMHTINAVEMNQIRAMGTRSHTYIREKYVKKHALGFKVRNRLDSYAKACISDPTPGLEPAPYRISCDFVGVGAQ